MISRAVLAFSWFKFFRYITHIYSHRLGWVLSKEEGEDGWTNSRQPGLQEILVLICRQHAQNESERGSERALHYRGQTCFPTYFRPSPANEVSGISHACRRQGLVSRGP